MSDLIDRQAAIDALSQYPFEKVVNCLSILEELPSVQPSQKNDSNTLEALDCVSRQAAIEALRRAEALTRAFGYHNVIDTIRELPSVQQWHVIKKRPMTNDERIEWSERIGYDIEYEDAFIYSNLPDDGEEVIVSSQYGNVYVDKFCQDEGCYFEENGDIDGIVAWMPLPEPWKGEEECI